MPELDQPFTEIIETKTNLLTVPVQDEPDKIKLWKYKTISTYENDHTINLIDTPVSISIIRKCTE